MNDPPITELEGFDKNGIHIAFARREWDTGRWFVRTRRCMLTVVSDEQEARETMQQVGAVTITESDGLKR